MIGEGYLLGTCHRKGMKMVVEPLMHWVPPLSWLSDLSFQS